MKKFRYHDVAMFIGTDDEEYQIDIPSPFLCDTKEEAKKSEDLTPRFLRIGGVPILNEPLLVIYDKPEDVEKGTTKEGKDCLLIRTKGEILKVYTYEEFKKAGGTLKMLKSECKGNVVTYEEDYVEINKTFTQCFPNMQMGKNYYVDSEAYWIEEIEVANDEEGERICNVNGADEKC